MLSYNFREAKIIHLQSHEVYQTTDFGTAGQDIWKS